MRTVEVTTVQRRLVRVLMRWRNASVTAIARSAQVSQGNLSRLLGTSGTPGMGAVKVAAVLRELNWDVDGPAQGLVQRWAVDDEEDVRWMFVDVLKSAASVSPLMPGSETLEHFDHVGILLCSIRSSRIVIEPAAGHEGLVDFILKTPGLVAVHNSVVLESFTEYKRVVEGRFAVSELADLIGRPPDRFELPDWLYDKAIQLWEILGSEEKIEDLIHDVRLMLARSAPDEYRRVVENEFSEIFSKSGPYGARADPMKLRRASNLRIEKLLAEGFRHPWSR